MFFPQEQLETTVLARLDDLSIIRVTGSDALEFLANQFTNDLKNLAENFSSMGAWCSIKGRVLYNFRIWREGEDFFLLLPVEHNEPFLKRLKMYVMRSDVHLETEPEICVFGLSGQDCQQDLDNAPEKNNQYLVNSNNQHTVIKIPSPVDRFLIVGKAVSNTTFSTQIVTEKRIWQLLDIMSGIPTIVSETSDMFLPQMLNLEALGGLSFQKGCYPGQEIVARVKYRGELKKQLYQAKISHQGQILPGTKLLAVANDKPAGFVINAAQLDKKTIALLVVVDIGIAQEDQVKLVTEAQNILDLQSL